MKCPARILTKFTRDCDEVLAVGRSLRLHHRDLSCDLLTIVVLTVGRCGERLCYEDLRIT